MAKKLLRKIYHVVKGNNKPTDNPNILKGPNTYIHPSTILTAVGNGKIIFESNNYIGRSVEIGTNGTIIIGDNTSIQDRCILLEDIEIGKNCIFAPNVYISSGRHYFDHKPNLYIKDQDALVANDPLLSKQHSRKVIIGDDCWLGINSVIMPGVKIGRGCVIGANSVVTHDIEPFSVVGGIPAKVLKARLEFLPKNKISFDNDNDLPNFYKGFKVDLKSLQNSRAIGGIYAEREFTCFLNSNAKTLEIELMPLWHGKLVISYNGQELVAEGKQTIVLSFNAGNMEYHKFTIKEHSTVLIKSVSAKN